MKINILVTLSLIISTNISFEQKKELGKLAVETLDYYFEIPTSISRPNLVPSIMSIVMINFSSNELSLITNKAYRDVLELKESLYNKLAVIRKNHRTN